MKKNIIWIVGIVVIVFAIFGVYSYTQKQNTTDEKISVDNSAELIEITANQDQTVLDVLKANNEVDYTDSSSGAFINKINGIENTDSKYWSYSVNGVDGMVAADKYICKKGDKIKWQYKSF